MAIATHKNIKASNFKYVCKYGMVDGVKWWTNGNFMLKEDLLSKRTLSAISKYKHVVETSSIVQLHATLISKIYKTIYFRQGNIPYQDKMLDMFTDREGNYTIIQSCYLPRHWSYLSMSDICNTIVNFNVDNHIDYAVMPFNYNEDILQKSLLIQQRQINKNRFIALLSED